MPQAWRFPRTPASRLSNTRPAIPTRRASHFPCWACCLETKSCGQSTHQAPMANQKGLQIAWREEPVLRLYRYGSGVEIHHGGFHEGVAELFFDGEDMSTPDQQCRRERVTKQVRVDSLRDVRPLRHNLHEVAEILRPIRVAVLERHEQRFRRSGSWPIPVQILHHQPGAR